MGFSSFFSTTFSYMSLISVMIRFGKWRSHSICIANWIHLLSTFSCASITYLVEIERTKLWPNILNLKWKTYRSFFLHGRLQSWVKKNPTSSDVPLESCSRVFLVTRGTATSFVMGWRVEGSENVSSGWGVKGRDGSSSVEKLWLKWRVLICKLVLRCAIFVTMMHNFWDCLRFIEHTCYIIMCNVR